MGSITSLEKKSLYMVYVFFVWFLTNCNHILTSYPELLYKWRLIYVYLRISKPNYVI